MSDLLQLSGLQIVMPTTSPQVLEPFVPVLRNKLPELEINTPLREAHFIAQLAHESGGFRYQKENLNYSEQGLRTTFAKYFPDDDVAHEYARNPEQIANRVYANRIGNGDEASGDGWRYRGRGLIQLTGKANYEACAAGTGIDLLDDPEQICEDHVVTVTVAGWFWQSNKLNPLADKDDIDAITKRINGGLNGLADRKEYLARCKKILGLRE